MTVINQVTTEEIELRLYSYFHGVVDSIEWGNAMSCLLVQRPMLREITIVGSRKGGKICLTIQKILNLKIHCRLKMFPGSPKMELELE